MSTFIRYRWDQSLTKAGYGPGSTGGSKLELSDGRTFDVVQEIADGSGEFRIDESDTELIALLDAYWPVERIGTTTTPPATPRSFGGTVQATLTDPQPSDTLTRDASGRWVNRRGLAVSLDDYWDQAIYATKADALQAAVDATVITANVNGATIVASQGVYDGLDGLVEFPAYVNLVGQGKRSVTRFVCASADAGLRFRSRGSVTGGFTIDGAGIATQPFWTDGVKRSFQDIDVRNANGHGYVVENAQNCTFDRLMVDSVTGSCYRLKNGASSNHFRDCDGEQQDRYLIEQDQDLAFGATIPDTGGTTVLASHPSFNAFTGSVIERFGETNPGTALGGVYCAAGTLILNDLTMGPGTMDTETPCIIADMQNPGAIGVNHARITIGGLSSIISDVNNSVGLETRNSSSQILIYGRFDLTGHKIGYRLADNSALEVHGQIVRTSVTTRFAHYSTGTQAETRIVRQHHAGSSEWAMSAVGDEMLVGRVIGDAGFRWVMTAQGFYGMDGASATNTNFPSIRWGTGSPEGVVSARIGSLYMRVDGTAGFELYKKASGTGVSGWAPWTTVVSAQTVATDANLTLTPNTSPEVTLHTGTLTADRTITLSTTTVQDGHQFRVTRTGAGAFNLSVGGLKNLATNQWCEVTRIGGAWVLTAFGSL